MLRPRFSLLTLPAFAVVLLAVIIAITFSTAPGRAGSSVVERRPTAITKLSRGDIYLPTESILQDSFIVAWYGNPNSEKMGILGRYSGLELAAALRAQAEAYRGVVHKRVVPAYELVAVVAQGQPGRDGLYRRRESTKIIDRLLAEARQNKFKLILDVQVGHSTVDRELEFLRPYLEQPDVYLALDPEFDMPEGKRPGGVIGTTRADDVNYAIAFVDRIVRRLNLPPKVLIVHQFTLNMLPDKQRIKDSPLVDLVLDMDGFGGRPLKRAVYRMVMKQRELEYAAIKLFYRQDDNILAPADLMAFKPLPALVIYQ